MCTGTIARATKRNIPGRRWEGMEEGLTNNQLNVILETIAKLIEAKATQEAAQIVRDAKTK